MFTLSNIVYKIFKIPINLSMQLMLTHGELLDYVMTVWAIVVLVILFSISVVLALICFCASISTTYRMLGKALVKAWVCCCKTKVHGE